jgi:hypothetical protein
MKSRCDNPNNIEYKNYGGRGITYYSTWKQFDNFYSYIMHSIGERPTLQHSLDRINNDKGYEPGNIKWSTDQEQSNNTRKNIFLEYNGQTKTISQWSEITGISRMTMYYRLNYLHWPIERTITEPAHSEFRNKNL